MAKLKSNRERLSEIASVFGKYGFGHVYRIYIRSTDQIEDARKLRLAFEELGPSFIKIGQILSTRQDLLPKPYVKELEKLQTATPTVAYEKIEPIIRSEFEQPLEEVFKSIDPVPLASASIAQIHRAVLWDGTQVVIKVQRPGIEDQLMQDIHLFSRLLSMAPDSMKDIISNVDAAFREIEQASARELNFRIEGRSIIRFQNNNQDSPLITAPEVYMDLTSKRVLVEEYVEGIPVNDNDSLISEGYVLEDISQKLIFSFLKQVFEDGFYHGDLHPGNILIRDQKIVLIDFGLTGELSESTRTVLIEMTKAALTNNMSDLMALILQVSATTEKVDDVTFYDDLIYYFNQYSGRAIQHINFSTLFNQLMNVMQKHKLALPHEMVMLARSIILLEGVISELDANVDVMSIMRKFYSETDIFNFFSFPSKERLALDAYTSAESLAKLPTGVAKFLDQLTNGRFVVNAQITDHDNHWSDLEQMVNRLIYALVLSALILASAIIVATSSGGISIIAIIVFFAAVVVGASLLIALFKSGMF